MSGPEQRPGPRRNRKAPAYQEYASDLLADERIRSMSLAERGLLCSMRWQCWHGDSVPADTVKLSRLVGATEEELSANLTSCVRSFFVEIQVNGESRLQEPELAAYREQLEEKRQQQQHAGKLGAESRWSGSNTPPDGERHSERHSERTGVLRRAELSREERSTPVSITSEEEDEEERSMVEAFRRVGEKS